MAKFLKSQGEQKYPNIYHHHDVDIVDDKQVDWTSYNIYIAVASRL